MSDDELAAIERLCNAATEGPWKYTDFLGDDVRLDIVSQDGDGGADAFDLASDWTDLLIGENRYANAAFMAYARTDVPALIAEVRRLREEVAENDELRPIVKSAITELVRQLHAENERLRDLLRELVAYGIRYRHCGEECVTDMVRMARSGIPREVVND